MDRLSLALYAFHWFLQVSSTHGSTYVAISNPWSEYHYRITDDGSQESPSPSRGQSRPGIHHGSRTYPAVQLHSAPQHTGSTNLAGSGTHHTGFPHPTAEQDSKSCVLSLLHATSAFERLKASVQPEELLYTLRQGIRSSCGESATAMLTVLSRFGETLSKVDGPSAQHMATAFVRDTDSEEALKRQRDHVKRLEAMIRVRQEEVTTQKKVASSVQAVSAVSRRELEEQIKDLREENCRLKGSQRSDSGETSSETVDQNV